MREELALAATAVASCASPSAWSWSDGELVEGLDVLHRMAQQVAAAQLAVIRALDSRGVPVAQGASSTKVWLRDRLRISIGSASKLVRLAAAVDQVVPATGDGLAAGAVNVEQAQVIANAVAELSAEVGVEVRQQADRLLVEQAGALDPAGLRIAGRRILEHVAPDVAEAHERRKLEQAEQRARERRFFTLAPDGDGGVRLRGLLDDAAAAIVRAALDPLTSPRRRHPQQGDEGCPDADRAPRAEGLPGGGHEGRRDRDDDALLDERTPAQRRADALVEICARVLAGGDLPAHGGDRPAVVVTVDFDVTAQELGAGTLDSGERVSPETVRRMACDAKLIPAVLGSRGIPLDLGRERRLFTGALRRALVLRDRGCAFPGCDRPPQWCDGHHLWHWADGGPTCLSNGCLLCDAHHDSVHRGGWQACLGADGLPEFIPPAWIDQQRRPRRNARFATAPVRDPRPP